MEDLTKGDSFGKDFDAIEHEFDEIINNNDYVQALKKYNNKGLLARVDGYKDLFIRKIAGNSELIQNIVSNLFYNQPIVSELQNTLRNRQSL